MNHSTVSGWIKEAVALIEPVYNLHCKEVLNTSYLNADETTIKVLDKEYPIGEPHHCLVKSAA
ncbi:MAG: IS66 family transposase [Bacteroidota bacterium]